MCSSASRLMGRSGKVDAYWRIDCISNNIIVGFSSPPVYPALHEHLYEPTVFWHTELTSHEWELHVVEHLSKSKINKKLWERTLRHHGCELMVNAEE